MIAVDIRSPSDIGRVARLDLVFAYRRGRTVLAHAYAEPPYRVGRLLDAGTLGPSAGAGRIAHMILVCSGPGIFAGDRLEQRVRVERGARVLLVSQAALQLHPAAARGPSSTGRQAAVPRGPSACMGLGPSAHMEPASIDSRYEIEDEATLDCFWDPLIPFTGARLKQRIDLRIAAEGEVFWSDALMSGRVGRGERWGFAALDHELRASVGGSLKYLERYDVVPPSRFVTHTWSAQCANYLGTTIVRSAAATHDRAEDAQRRLSTIKGVGAGIDCLESRLVVGRLLAESGPPFASARAALRDVFERPRLRRT